MCCTILLSKDSPSAMYWPLTWLSIFVSSSKRTLAGLAVGIGVYLTTYLQLPKLFLQKSGNAMQIDSLFWPSVQLMWTSARAAWKIWNFKSNFFILKFRIEGESKKRAVNKCQLIKYGIFNDPNGNSSHFARSSSTNWLGPFFWFSRIISDSWNFLGLQRVAWEFKDLPGTSKTSRSHKKLLSKSNILATAIGRRVKMVETGLGSQ